MKEIGKYAALAAFGMVVGSVQVLISNYIAVKVTEHCLKDIGYKKEGE